MNRAEGSGRAGVGHAHTARDGVLDIAVVGAGIVGCLIAREIMRRRPESIIGLFDRAGVGDGATRRSAGLHIPRGATDAMRSWTRYSEHYYQQLLSEQPALPIRSLGMVVLSRARNTEHLSEIYLDRLRPASGGLSEPLGPLPSGTTAWSADGAQHADVGQLTRALAARMRSVARVHEGVEVSALDLARDHVVLDLAAGGTARARDVVLAPGPWVHDKSWKKLIDPLGTRVKKVVALHLDAVPDEQDPTVIFHDQDAFLLPLPDRGHWLFSYPSRQWDVDPATLSGPLSPTDLDEGRQILRTWCPQLADRANSGRVFCDAYSASREPEVREIAPRVVFAGAANGSGYRLAPAIAARTVEALSRPSQRKGPAA
jgi:glycine/D-amino acid oxidase-like deaminating enzyme